MHNSDERHVLNAGIASESGMTLLELLVSSTISLSAMAMMIGMVVSNRVAYTSDLARTRLHQNLRSAFDVIGAELRQAGERLPFSFPAILVVNGASGAPDRLILRRNVIDQTLILCEALTTTTTGGRFKISSPTAGLPPACSYGAQTTAYNQWRSFRTAQGGRYRVFAYDMASHFGEFFTYDTETDSGASQYIHSASSAWAHNYALGTTSAYAISEWEFGLSSVPGQTDLLQVIPNGDTSNPWNVVYGVTDLQLTVLMNDGTTRTSFGVGDNWGQVTAIAVTISGRDTYDNGRKVVTATLRTELFPRNVLSN